MEGLIAGLEAYIGSSILISLGICFAGGVLASLSPCVYPLIPIVATYVGSRSVEAKTKKTAFILSVTYVIGMAAVYTCLGMVAALTGQFFGQMSTNPWAQFLVGNIIIFLGLNVLEVIPLPALSMQSKGEQGKGGLIGAFFIGAASGLIASPCTVPVIGIILTFVATTQNVLQGAVLLFSFSIGMGILLIFVGTFSGVMTSMPRPGNWMYIVRKVFGIAMILVGEYFLIKAGQLMV